MNFRPTALDEGSSSGDAEEAPVALSSGWWDAKIPDAAVDTEEEKEKVPLSSTFKTSINNLRRLHQPEYAAIALAFYEKAYEILARFYQNNYQEAHLIDMLPKPEAIALDLETYGLPGSDFLKKVRYALDPDNGGRFEMRTMPIDSSKTRGFKTGPDVSSHSVVIKARREMELQVSFARKNELLYVNEMEDIQTAYFWQLEYSGANSGLLQVARNARLRILQHGVRENPFTEAHVIRGASCADIIENAETYLYERVSEKLKQDASLWIYRTPGAHSLYREFLKTAPDSTKHLAVRAKNAEVNDTFNLPPELRSMFANTQSPGLCWLHPEGLSDDALIELIFQRFKNTFKKPTDVTDDHVDFIQTILSKRFELFGPRMSLLYILQHVNYGISNFARALKEIEMKYPELFMFSLEFDSRQELPSNQFLKVRMHVPGPENEALMFYTYFPYLFRTQTNFGSEIIRHYNEWLQMPGANDSDLWSKERDIGPLDEKIRWMVASEMRAVAERVSVKQKYEETDYITVDATELKAMLEMNEDQEKKKKNNGPGLKKKVETEMNFQNFDSLQYWLYGFSPDKTIFFPGAHRVQQRPKFTCNVFTDWESQDEAFLQDFDETDRSDKIVLFSSMVNYFSEAEEYKYFHFVDDEVNGMDDFFEKMYEEKIIGGVTDEEILNLKPIIKDGKDENPDKEFLKNWFTDELNVTEDQRLMLIQKIHARASDIGRLAVAHSVAEAMWQFGQELRACDVSAEENASMGIQERLATIPELSTLFARLSATLYERDKMRSAIGTTQFERNARMREINMLSEDFVAQIQKKLGDTPRLTLPPYYNTIR